MIDISSPLKKHCFCMQKLSAILQGAQNQGGISWDIMYGGTLFFAVYIYLKVVFHLCGSMFVNFMYYK